MKNSIIFLFFLFSFYNFSSSQTLIDNICWIKSTETLFPSEDSTLLTNNDKLNSLLNHYNVTEYEHAFPYSKRDVLRKIIEIRCDTCDVDLLHNVLKDSFPNTFFDFERHKRYDSIKTSYTPADQLWNDPSDLLWHLKKNTM